MDFRHRVLPFYMTYPGQYGLQSDREVLRDLEYLQQCYPGEVKRYQSRISQILDKMDYEGSMIYDEYPDRYSLERLARSILTVLRREESEREPGREEPEEKWEWAYGLVVVLLHDEVYKRRHGGRRGFISFS